MKNFLLSILTCTIMRHPTSIVLISCLLDCMFYFLIIFLIFTVHDSMFAYSVTLVLLRKLHIVCEY